MQPQALKQHLKTEATRLDGVMAADLAAVSNQRLAQVLEHALFAGGKRVRPLLTLLAANLTAAARKAAPTVAADKLDLLAISFEYLHGASLLHDDVIDHASQRRGRETVNQRWDTAHAILAGDFLHARAMLLAGSAGGVTCLELIGEATQAMVAAEFLQNEAMVNQDWREETYFAVLEGKTAALIAAACECGAVSAGGDGEQRRALYRYGANLGLAFQIVDDLLDFLGDPAATGKAVGNDLQEGKMTLPLLLAGQTASEAEGRRLREIMALAPSARRAAFAEVRGVLEKTGAFAACRRRAEELIAAGIAGLAIFPGGREVEVLSALGTYVLHRNQ